MHLWYIPLLLWLHTHRYFSTRAGSKTQRRSIFLYFPRMAIENSWTRQKTCLHTRTYYAATARITDGLKLGFFSIYICRVNKLNKTCSSVITSQYPRQGVVGTSAGKKLHFSNYSNSLYQQEYAYIPATSTRIKYSGICIYAIVYFSSMG